MWEPLVGFSLQKLCNKGDMYVNGTLTAFNPDSYALASSPSRFIEIVTFCFSVVRIHSGNDFPEKRKLAINQMKLYTRTLDSQGLLHLLVLYEGKLNRLVMQYQQVLMRLSTNCKSQIETSFCWWSRWIGRRRKESEFGSTRRPTAIAHV